THGSLARIWRALEGLGRVDGPRLRPHRGCGPVNDTLLVPFARQLGRAIVTEGSTFATGLSRLRRARPLWVELDFLYSRSRPKGMRYAVDVRGLHGGGSSCRTADACARASCGDAECRSASPTRQ